MVVDQNHHGDREAGDHCHTEPNAPLSGSIPSHEPKRRRVARKVIFSCPTVDWLPVERGIVGRQGAEALMLCGRWRRSDALPPGLMALLKITHLAAACVSYCGFLPFDSVYICVWALWGTVCACERTYVCVCVSPLDSWRAKACWAVCHTSLTQESSGGVQRPFTADVPETVLTYAHSSTSYSLF